MNETYETFRCGVNQPIHKQIGEDAVVFQSRFSGHKAEACVRETRGFWLEECNDQSKAGRAVEFINETNSTKMSG